MSTRYKNNGFKSRNQQGFNTESGKDRSLNVTLYIIVMSMVMGYTCYLCDVITKLHKSTLHDDEEVLLGALGSRTNSESRHYSRLSSDTNLRLKNYHRTATGHYTDSKNLISITPLTISNVRFSQQSSIQSETWNL